MAVLFGKETFEGGSLPAAFDSQTSSGGGSGVIDSTSKVNGTYSMKLGASALGASYLIENHGTDYSELYFQFSIFIPTAFAYNTAVSLVLLHVTDNADATVFELKMDDYGTQQIILQGGTLGYTDTTLTLSKNAVHKVEVYFKANATTGAWKVWIDNNTEGSPNASATGLNTGTTQLRKSSFGLYYADGSITDNFYVDDFVVADTFIGALAGVSPSASLSPSASRSPSASSSPSLSPSASVSPSASRSPSSSSSPSISPSASVSPSSSSSASASPSASRSPSASVSPSISPSSSDSPSISPSASLSPSLSPSSSISPSASLSASISPSASASSSVSRSISPSSSLSPSSSQSASISASVSSSLSPSSSVSASPSAAFGIPTHQVRVVKIDSELTVNSPETVELRIVE